MGPLPDGIYRAEFPYLYRAPKGFTEAEAVDYSLKRLTALFDEATFPEDVAAIVVEPVQGEGGFIPVPKAWVQGVRKLCDQHGILLIADEVQTGFARSGRMFVSDYWTEWGAAPDIIAMAKSIAGGLPLSAITTSAAIMDKVAPGVIGGTLGGNMLSCAAALKILDIMQRDNIPGRALAISEKCRAVFTGWQKDIPAIGDIRGIGAMMGIEFIKDTAKTPWPELVTSVVQEAVKRGLVVENAGTYGNVIRFLCPLVVTDAQLDAGLAILKEAIQVSIGKL
jgi:4-aminobutyrate aminotransferase/(S)-3-amino-2-methylpropionate transaminase